MTGTIRLLILCSFCLSACDRPAPPAPPAPQAPPPAASAEPAAEASAEPPPGASTGTEPPAGAPAAADPPGAPTDRGEPELRAEERERDPRSQTVKLRLSLSPAARGIVMWGRKKIGEFKPGAMVLDFERPRSSGPIDLVIRAEGFLPHHVRLFTDRDDKLFVRLYRAEDARGLLGYRRSADTP